MTTTEEDLILFLLRHDSFFVPVAQTLPLEWIDQAGRGGILLMALLNEAAHGHFTGIREAINGLDDDLRTEAARLSAQTFAGKDEDNDLYPRINLILKAFHARNLQAIVRGLDARIAATAPSDVASLNRLQAEKIALRKSHFQSPSLSPSL